jgi:hypothetical protein
MKITERFAALDNNLKLDPDERQLAQDLHQSIEGILVGAGLAKRCRLQGSFARKTMLPPLHDVDKVVELVDARRDDLGSPIGPRSVMEEMKILIQAEYPGATFSIKKHSLGICLPGHDFDFDAVPAFASDQGPGWVDIANTMAGLGEDVWKPSNTYDLIDVVKQRNGECGGRFIRQVRMVKQACATAGLSKVLPGLHVESFTYEAVTKEMDFAEAVADTLVTAAALLGGAYTDPTGVDAISERIDVGTVFAIQPVVANMAMKATGALEAAANDDEVGAAHIWAQIFGDLFPAPTDADVREAEQRRAVTKLYSGGTLAATNRSAVPSRAWRP